MYAWVDQIINLLKLEFDWYLPKFILLIVLQMSNYVCYIILYIMYYLEPTMKTRGLNQKK